MAAFFPDMQSEIAALIVRLCNIKAALANAYERNDQLSQYHLLSQYLQCQNDIIHAQAYLISRHQQLWDSVNPYGTQNSSRRTPD